MNDNKGTLANFGFDVQLTSSSALYLFLALAMSSIVFWTARKILK